MSQTYDYAVIGSGLSGLLIANILSQETSNVALIEALDHPGGFNHSVSLPTGAIDNGLRFLPYTPMAESNLLFLENVLGLKIIKGIEEHAPVTYESGQFKSFLGFGDNPPEYYEDLRYFTHPQRFQLNLPIYKWAGLLFENFKGEFLPRSHVTQFVFEDKQLTQIKINGAKTIKALNFIYCGPIKSLLHLLPEAQLPAKVRQKLSKVSFGTAIGLDICHSQKITDSQAMHILTGSGQEDSGTYVGYFLPTNEEHPGKQVSQWLTFLNEENSEDMEVVGQALKKMKRQIKRAYPTALDSIIQERIMVAPNITGQADLKLKENFTFAEIPNLWLGSSTVNLHKNLIGTLSQAQNILAALGAGAVQMPVSNEAILI